MLASFLTTRELSCLRGSILEWTRVTRSEFFKIVVATVRKSGREPRERLARLQALGSREQRCLRRRRWSERSRVALLEIRATRGRIV